MTTDTATTTHAAGLKTDAGKRIASRNATTHGLFARDVVLPRLGEDPAAYEVFLAELTNQLAPKNLLEQHYAEKIAAASWHLRRLHRWQAQLFEDMELPEEEIMLRLDRVMRHETTLHRQIDTSVKMLGRELPRLFEGRVREDLIRRLGETERGCRDDPCLDQWLTEEARRRSSLPTAPPSLDLSRLDTMGKDNAPIEANCQNGPSVCRGMTRHAPTDYAQESCQNGPSHALSPSPCSPAPHYWGGGASSGEVARDEPEGVPPPRAGALRRAKRFKQKQKCQNGPALAPAHPLPPALADPEGGR